PLWSFPLWVSTYTWPSHSRVVVKTSVSGLYPDSGSPLNSVTRCGTPPVRGIAQTSYPQIRPSVAASLEAHSCPNSTCESPTVTTRPLSGNPSTGVASWLKVPFVVSSTCGRPPVAVASWTSRCVRSRESTTTYLPPSGSEAGTSWSAARQSCPTGLACPSGG